MAGIKLKVVSPERTVLEAQADSITCLTEEGFITVLPGHTSLVSTLVSGPMTVKTGKHEEILHVGGGFIHVNPAEVRILSDAAERIEDIDLARAEEAKRMAEAELREQTMSDEEYAMTAALLKRNLSRINIVRKHSHRRSRITGEGVLSNE